MPFRVRPLWTLLAAAAVAVSAACYEDPQRVMDQQQQLTDMADALNDMGFQLAEMQGTLDSLRLLVARQDTAIYRMANVTGVPYQR